jgi:hypothetical protein
VFGPNNCVKKWDEIIIPYKASMLVDDDIQNIPQPLCIGHPNCFNHLKRMWEIQLHLLNVLEDDYHLPKDMYHERKETS